MSAKHPARIPRQADLDLSRICAAPSARLGHLAFEGDGVPKAEVQRLLRRAETDAQRLIAECEAARVRLKGGIEHEYRAMRQGESHVSGLLGDARALAQLT